MSDDTATVDSDRSPGEGRTNITVKDDTFELLKRNKPEGVTWDYHLTQLQYATDHRLADPDGGAPDDGAAADGGGG